MATVAKLTTTVSTKGQVVLPKAVRDHAGFAPGSRLSVEVGDGQVVLRPEPVRKHSTMEEVFGCLKHDGPPVTIERMRDAGAAYVRAERGRVSDDLD